MSANSLDVQPVAANHRLECIVGSMALGNEQLGVAQVADARREPESQKVHQAEHMIGGLRPKPGKFGYPFKSTIYNKKMFSSSAFTSIGSCLSRNA